MSARLGVRACQYRRYRLAARAYNKSECYYYKSFFCFLARRVHPWRVVKQPHRSFVFFVFERLSRLPPSFTFRA